MSGRTTTRISTKGQVVLPKALRERRGWAAGDELLVEEWPDRVVLRPAKTLAPSRMEDVFGSLGPHRPAASLDDMNRSVLDEAARRWRRKGFARD